MLLFMSKVPIFQHDVLDKIPFVKSFYVGEYSRTWSSLDRCYSFTC